MLPLLAGQASHKIALEYCQFLSPQKVKNNIDVDNEFTPYGIIRMIEPFKGQEWTLTDYEPEVEEILNGKKSCVYSSFSLEGINKKLSGSNDDTDYWTEDIDKAIEISIERYKKYHPTGKAYDVVSYWDDCDRQVVNQKPLIYQEACELCNQKRSTLRSGSLYYYGVEIHRENNKEE